jgi:FHS family Na+ dependent glucose MFS transporter 1
LSSVTEEAGSPAASLRPLASTYAYSGSFVGLGLVAASLGPTLPALAAQTRSDVGQIALLFTARSIGYLLGSLLGGRAYDRIAGHPLMAAAMTVMALCMFAVPLAPLLWILATVLLALGFAEGFVDVGGNTLLLWVHRSRVGPYMNALHFFFGLGAFLSPIVMAQAMLMSGSILWGYWLLALFMAPMVIWILQLQSPRHMAVQASPGGERKAVVINWRLLSLVMLFMCIYVGVETGVGGWISTYALKMGLADETSAAYLASVFWGAFTIARLISIPLAAQFRPRLLLAVDLLGCLAFTALIVFFPQSEWALWIGVFGIGLFIASIFPTVMTWSERRMTMSGQVTSMFLVGSSIGGILFPWFIGQLIAMYGAWIAIPTVLVIVVALFIVFMLLMAYGGPPQIEAENNP